MMTPDLLLASNSPRRRELIALGDWKFQIHPANIEELDLPQENPTNYVIRLAETKARAVASLAKPGWLVVGADTIVVDDTPAGAEILEKPADPSVAFRMLTQLRGRSHQVLTALAVLDPAENHLITDLCVTEVMMRSYNDDEISAYVASGDPMDKAGAYAIQHAFFQPVDHLQGCYASVMGLPLCHLQRTLSQFGVVTDRDLPQACQIALKYDCRVFEMILDGSLINHRVSC